MRRVVDEAFEVVYAGDGPVLLTCEHASLRLPEGWSWPELDRWLVGTHWSYDLGIADFTLELASALRCPAVLARFSRLLCDANREEMDPSLFRDSAEGRLVHLNATLDAEERERRLAAYHRPYHAAVSQVAREVPGKLVFSMHSFTPIYEGNPREVEIGVLFDTEDALATDFALSLVDRGFPTWLNEPYSGKEGLIYAATRHAADHGRRALELEIRQDLLEDPTWRSRAVVAVAEALAEVGLV